MTYALIVGLLIIVGTVAVARNIKGGLTPELDALIAEKAIVEGLEPALVKAIARVESNFNPSAKNPADPSYGLMQVTPALAYDYGLIVNYRNPSQYEINKLLDPAKNLNVACAFLGKLYSKYSFDETVQMYNVGEAGYLKGRRNLPYLEKVKVYYERYSQG